MIDLAKEIRELEAKSVYIHLGHDHYEGGSNCIWAIEILDDKRYRKYHTMWHNDNHEFGDTVDCYIAAIRFAKWLLEGENAKWFFFSARETVTDEGRADWLKSRAFREEASKVLYGEE